MINALSKSATRTGAVLSLAVGLFCLFSPSGLGQTLYGGLAGHNNGDSTNDGALATVNPNTGAVSIVGHPAGVTRISERNPLPLSNSPRSPPSVCTGDRTSRSRK